MSQSGLHSKVNPDWQTPLPYILAAREVMGRIDLDPASDAAANAVVEATRYFDAEADGLEQDWSGAVFLNPPGGQVNAFWRKLMAEYRRRAVDQAVWIGYSLEQLQTLQVAAAGLTPLHFSICVPDRRIAFVESAARQGQRLEKVRAENALRVAKGLKPKSEKTGPSHANYITYLGPHRDAFYRAFSTFGVVALR